MTTYAEARDTIVGILAPAWAAAYPTVPVLYDNSAPVNRDSVSEYIFCQISFNSSAQREMGSAPAMRTYGTLAFSLGVKEADGYRNSLVRAGFLSSLYRFKALQGVIFGAPHPVPPSNGKGWFYTGLIVPFYFDG